MTDNSNIKSEKEEENNLLFSLKVILGDKKENPFFVPENYFEHLPQEVMEKILEKKKEKGFVLISRPVVSFSWRFGIAAVLSGLILFLIFFFPPRRIFNNRNISTSEEIILSSNEIQYIIENPDLYNIDETTITEQYVSGNIEFEPGNGNGLSEDEINNYLEENMLMVNDFAKYLDVSNPDM